MKLNILMTILVLAFPILGACTQTPQKTAVTGLLTSAGFQVPTKKVAAPDFKLQDLQGKPTGLADYRGKIVLLNFWATWCPPCRAEMPSMEKIYSELKSSDFEIVAVDLQEDAKTVRNFISEKGFTFPVLLDTTGSVGSTYGARSIPTSYLVDRDGTLLGMTIGGREWTDEKTMKLLSYLTKNER